MDELDGALEFLKRVVEKVEQIRQDLGRVGPVIAEQVEEAMLGRRAQLDTAAAEVQAGAIRETLRFERDLRARIAQLNESLQDTRRALNLTPERMRQAVVVALELAGQPPLREVEVSGIWPDPSGRHTRCPVYAMPALTGSWARCSEGLAHPHTGAVRPIVFDHNLARGRDDVVLVHLNHRLVQMALRLLRAEVWNTQAHQGLYRVAARLVPDNVLEVPAVVAHARLVVVGGARTRLHEEIISAGGLIRDGRFRRLNVGEVNGTLAAALDAEPSPRTKERLAAAWPAVREPLVSALETRRRDRLSGLESLLERRRAKETDDIATILGELEQIIRAELGAPRMQQLELFSPAEREQYSRNVSALRARLAQIPGELEAETGAIAARYADPQARLFPVAVTFLVPARYAE